KAGDLGFLDEGTLRESGFPPELVQTFFQMREGDITPPVKGTGRYFIFKLTAKRTQEEKLTLDSPQVKAQISQLLMGQRKEILNSALLSAALHQARVENYLAQRMLQNPDNFGSLRPTSLSNTGAKNEENKENKENKEDKPAEKTTPPAPDSSSGETKKEANK
ncbi:MAG: peptidyl-prolyl cis-trans isomerase, partial [Acidobacteriota bacterium]